jgi:DNA-directed RNA polymerase specialized sigma24 family protein
MLRVTRSYPSFDGRSSLNTWATAIARRVIVDHFRREPSKALVSPPPADAIVGMASAPPRSESTAAGPSCAKLWKRIAGCTTTTTAR